MGFEISTRKKVEQQPKQKLAKTLTTREELERAENFRALSLLDWLAVSSGSFKYLIKSLETFKTKMKVRPLTGFDSTIIELFSDSKVVLCHALA